MASVGPVLLTATTTTYTSSGASSPSSSMGEVVPKPLHASTYIGVHGSGTRDCNFIHQVMIKYYTNKLVEFIDVYLKVDDDKKLQRLGQLKEGDHERLAQLAKLRRAVLELEREREADHLLQRFLIIKQSVVVTFAAFWGWYHAEIINHSLANLCTHTKLAPTLIATLLACTLYNPFNVALFSGLRTAWRKFREMRNKERLALVDVWKCYKLVTVRSVADKVYEVFKVRYTDDEIAENIAIELGCKVEDLPKGFVAEFMDPTPEEVQLEDEEEEGDDE